jgi:hypothetical protein
MGDRSAQHLVFLTVGEVMVCLILVLTAAITAEVPRPAALLQYANNNYRPVMPFTIRCGLKVPM